MAYEHLPVVYEVSVYQAWCVTVQNPVKRLAAQKYLANI